MLKILCSRPLAEEMKMKVTIDFVTLIAEEVFVEFSTDVGSATAVWCATPPKVGDQYDVELEVADELVWGDTYPALNNVHSIKVADGVLTMTGTLISYDTNGCAVVDVGGSKILVELIGCTEAYSVFVDFKIKNIKLYPTGV